MTSSGESLEALEPLVGEWSLVAVFKDNAVHRRRRPRHVTGIFSDDGKSIAGRWEISHDGKTWEHDFDLTYIKAE